MIKKILILFFTIFILTSCGDDNINKKIIKKYETELIKKGTITETKGFIGTNFGISETKISAKYGGKIIYINGNIGDKVNKGELLIKLDSEESKINYKTSNNILDSLYLLKKETKKSFDNQIKSLENKINQIKSGIKGGDTSISDINKINNSQDKEIVSKKNIILKSLDLAKEKLVKSKINLDENKKTFIQNEKNIYNSGKTAITQNIILNTNILNFSDILLGVSKKNKKLNDKFDDYLGKKDSVKLNETINKYIEVQKEFDEYKEFYNDNIENKEKIEDYIILDGIKKGTKVSENIKKMLSLIYDTLDNSIENIYFTLDEINSYKKQITDFGINLEKTILSTDGGVIVGLKAVTQNLENLEISKNKIIKLLEKDIITNKKNIELVKSELIGLNSRLEIINTGNKIKINDIKTKNEISNNQIKEIKNSIQSLINQRNSKIIEIDSNIKKVSGDKKISSVISASSKIFSSINGVIKSKFIENGEIVGVGQPLFTIIDNSKIKIKVPITDEILKKIKVGTKVVVENNDKLIKSKITSIGKSKDNISQKITVEILVDNKKGILKSGGKSIVHFPGSKIIGVKIPNSAIIEKYLIPGVFIIKGNKVEFRKIKILKRKNNYSIVSGLKEKEKVITYGSENIFDGEILEN